MGVPIPIIVDSDQLALLEQALSRCLRPITARAPLLVKDGPNAVELSMSRPASAPPAASAPGWTLFVVKEELDDVLRCRTYSLDDAGVATEGTDDLYVAKPPLLRKTPFHGNSINGKTYDYTDVHERTVTRDSDSFEEAQKITPDYETADGDYPGDFILATTDIGGGTAAVYNGQRVIWVDGNFDARAWAVV